MDNIGGATYLATLAGGEHLGASGRERVDESGEMRAGESGQLRADESGQLRADESDFIPKSLYLLDFSPKITNVFGIYIPKLLMMLGYTSQNY